MLKRLLTLVVFICLLCTGCKQSETPPDADAKLNPSFANLPEMSTDLASVEIMDDVALFSFTISGMSDASTTLISYDLASDSILGELTFENDYICIYPHEEQTFAIVSHRDMTIGIYDKTCQEISMTPVADVVMGIEAIAYQPNYLLFREVADGSVSIFNLKENKSYATDLKNGEYYWAAGIKNTSFLLSTDRQELLSLNTCGQSEFLYSAYSAQIAAEDFVVGSYGAYNLFYPLSNDERFMVPTHDEGEIFRTAEGQAFLSSTYKGLIYYDLTQNLSIECSFDEMICDADLEDTYAIAISRTADTLALGYHFVDFSEQQGQPFERLTYDPYLFREMEPVPEPVGNAQTVALIQEIEETYGVRVVYEDYYFTFYDEAYTYQLVDEETAYKRLTELKEVLDFFPEGIFFEINESFPMILVLCQEITPSVGGVNTLINGYNVSFVDATYENLAFQGTVAHEFAHAMEHRIGWRSLQAWTELMPEEALAAYGDDSLVLDFTPYDSGNTPAWFVSVYGRTNAQEDRATVFEAMFNSYSNGDMFLLNPEGIQLKMKFWSQMLQDTYRCCKNTTFAWDSLIK